MKKNSKKKNNSITFKKYMNICLFIVSIILCILTYFIDILPIDYFLVFVSVILIINLVVFLILRKNKTFNNFFGTILCIFMLIFMILGIIYELNTLDFFKQFGFNSYKTEVYNVVVLNDSKYEDLDDLDGLSIGHMDKESNEGLASAINKIDKKIDFESTVLDDASEECEYLIDGEVEAIILENAQMEILEDEEPDVYAMLRIIESFEIEIEIDEIGQSVDVTQDSFNIYISGIDTYGSITSVSRSDVNIVISVNPTTNEVLLTSIPRDYYVVLPTYNSYDKLTHAGIYGIEESIGAVEELLDIKINYYIKVNFTTLVDIVDALGGIEVNSEYAFTSVDGYTFSIGTNSLNGEEALAFARERYAFSNLGGDRIRGQNQQKVLTSILNKAMSPTIITNYSNLLSALDGEFLTNFTDDEITTLIKNQIKTSSSWNFSSISLDGTDSYQYTYSYKSTKLYVMMPDDDSVSDAKSAINKVLEGN